MTCAKSPWRWPRNCCRWPTSGSTGRRRGSRAEAALDDGRAAEHFERWCYVQGGRWQPGEFHRLAAHEVKAPSAGFVTAVDALAVGRAAQLAGAGRRTVDDTVDAAAGVVLERTVGDAVEAGASLAAVFSRDPARRRAGERRARDRLHRGSGEAAGPAPRARPRGRGGRELMETATMRVVGGAWRGRPLQAPAGRNTRPTSDKVREAVFDVLGALPEADPPPAGHVALDVFAGSGALGIEALSRGAARCTFVESAPPALRALRGNLERLGVPVVRAAAGDAAQTAAAAGPCAVVRGDRRPPRPLG